jgi:hypothetical protein
LPIMVGRETFRVRAATPPGERETADGLRNNGGHALPIGAIGIRRPPPPEEPTDGGIEDEGQVAVNPTVPAKPFRLVSVMLERAVPPTLRDIDVGLAVKPKSRIVT